MSYLDEPRIHFFGKYFADPSTINNDLGNYDLKPPLDLSWNPDGSAFFRFMDCAVGSVVGVDGDGATEGAGDPITRETSSQAAISVLVFNDIPAKDNPTWSPDIQPVLTQYATLYPGMTQRLDLSSDQAVSSNSGIVLEAISLPIGDPAHMPVTRDLAASQRAIIQTWIKNGCPEDGGDA
jgi:hypothetical protein